MSSTEPAEVLSGPVLAWPPEGAGDFADVAWLVAKALGNGAGVRGLEVERLAGRVRLFVTATEETYVREVAAQRGWSLYHRDGRYAISTGTLGGVTVTVSWTLPPPAEAAWVSG